jgi:prepilin-type N-terminal cleavage/methylation domain-containing protein
MKGNHCNMACANDVASGLRPETGGVTANRSRHSLDATRTGAGSKDSNRAFTLVELLVVLAILVLLATPLLPSLAGTKRNSTRAQCVANLRQIGVGCSVYANDFSGWYPIWGGYDASHQVNQIRNIHYTRYIFTSGAPDGYPMPQGYAVNLAPYNGWDQNLGYLYGGGIIPDGRAFFCPAFSEVSPNSPVYPLSPEYYSAPKFMSVHANGAVRSSYMFNPRMKYVSGTYADVQRKYQKVTDCKQIDVLVMDYLACPGANGNDPPGVPFTPDNWAHWPGKGLQVLFTDGSARFCTLTNYIFNGIVHSLRSDENTLSYLQYNSIFNSIQTNELYGVP